MQLSKNTDISKNIDKCQRCRKIFKKRSSTTKYCSRNCAHWVLRKRINKLCIVCNQYFVVSRSGSLKQKLCSVKCLSASRRKTFFCKFCKKEVSQLNSQNKQFCSKACYVNSVASKEKFFCKFCEKEIYKTESSKPKFCNRICDTEYRRSLMLEKNCKLCNSIFRVSKSQYAARMYCSSNCRMKWKESLRGNKQERENNKRYLKLYGITFEQALELKKLPCMICKDVSKDDIVIDHHHSFSKTLRGNLCSKCNQLLGKVEKNTDWFKIFLDNYKKYLKKDIRNYDEILKLFKN